MKPMIKLFIIATVTTLLLTGCSTPKMPQSKWEYKVITSAGSAQQRANDLNLLAEDGWEVVSANTIKNENHDYLSAVLRRPKK